MVRIDHIVKELGCFSKPLNGLQHELEYYGLFGDVIFRIEKEEFDALWEWIPKLNFVNETIGALAEICSEGRGVIGFSENDEQIIMTLENNAIEIKCTYNDNIAHCKFEPLLSEINKLVDKTIAFLDDYNLQGNATIVEMVAFWKKSLLDFEDFGKKWALLE